MKVELSVSFKKTIFAKTSSFVFEVDPFQTMRQNGFKCWNRKPEMRRNLLKTSGSEGTHPWTRLSDT